MIGLRQWSLMSALALGLHLLLILLLVQMKVEGALAAGSQGIDVDLGMLGDLGTNDMSNTSDALTDAKSDNTTLTEDIEPPDTSEAEKSQSELSQDNLPPVLSALVPDSVQSPDVLVKATEAHTSTDVVAESESYTELPAAEPENVPLAQTQTLDPVIQASVTDEKFVEVATDPQIAARKQSTGTAQAVTTGGDVGVRRSYFARLAAVLAKHKRYPIKSRRQGNEGVALLSFTVDRLGRVTTSAIRQSSGFDDLDRAVMKMLKSAEPLPPFPIEMADATLSISIPVAFQLHE